MLDQAIAPQNMTSGTRQPHRRIIILRVFAPLTPTNDTMWRQILRMHTHLLQAVCKPHRLLPRQGPLEFKINPYRGG
jgi:hypothetical protein